MTLTSAIFSNVKFKRREGTAVQGLRGCSYCTHPPRSSFELLSPSEAMQSQPEGWFGFDSEEKHGVIWKQKDAALTILKQKLSPAYAAPPEQRLNTSHFVTPHLQNMKLLSGSRTLLQGNKNWLRGHIYLFSPGSMSEKYGKDYFICTDPASRLVPCLWWVRFGEVPK
ncbi:hypothetical protein SLEP1_g30420 [Rubroshorea leprosula]|nr:hypothetical protein SLEP1_g30420 [Rubroshorea leprosula]